MSGLLKGDLDVAQAMIYNEYAQVLEAKNPATGQLYKPDDLNVIDFNDPAVGTAMLQDQIFASDKWLKTGNNADIADEVPAGVVQGLDLLPRQRRRSASTSCSAKGSQLGASHQAWQMNEINALIWPSPNGIGLLDKALYDQTVHDRHDLQGPQGRAVRRTRPGPTSPRRRSTRSARRSTPRARASQKGTVTLKEGGN